MQTAEPTPKDLDYGAFSEHAPWQLDPERLPWRRGLGDVRDATAREVPDLVRRRALPPFRRFGRTSALVGSALAGWAVRERRRGGGESRAGLSRRLRRAFEHLGPSYIKLGQILSAGKGVFPDELVDEFERCRDRVTPEPFDHVAQVVLDEVTAPPAKPGASR